MKEYFDQSWSCVFSSDGAQEVQTSVRGHTLNYVCMSDMPWSKLLAKVPAKSTVFQIVR